MNASHQTATILRLPPPRDPPPFEAAKRVVGAFDALSALKVAEGVVVLASMKLASRLPPMLARALYDARQSIDAAGSLARLYVEDRDAYDRREREHGGARG